MSVTPPDAGTSTVDAEAPAEGKLPFDVVVQRHGPTVLRVCRAVVGPVDADDAWSETFISALRAYPELPSTANVEAWLVTIAHRRAIDVHRARARRAVPVDDVSLVEDVGRLGGRGTSAGDGSTDAEDADALYAALARLPQRQREAVAYHHLGGVPHTEVAVIVGSTPAAVRRASADGIAALRRRLTSTNPPDSSPASSPAPPASDVSRRQSSAVPDASDSKRPISSPGTRTPDADPPRPSAAPDAPDRARPASSPGPRTPDTDRPRPSAPVCARPGPSISPEQNQQGPAPTEGAAR